MKRPQQITLNKNKKPCLDVPRSIDAQRRSLPIHRVRKRLFVEFERNETLILIGETGCGKTTQIPQFLNELGMEGDRRIGITQPRRVAAVTVANRVALESKSQMGQLVGYCVRFEDVTSPATKIKYLTDGMLLREAMQDDCLRDYNIIILDEAHERTIHTDVLFGIVKQAQKKRSAATHMKPLKIIVMSATMDVDHFSKYFNDAPVVYLEGRQYPVGIRHTVEPQDDYVLSCLVTVLQIHREAPPNHDILVFLTGQEEIEAMASSIRSISKDPDCGGPQIRVFPLYAALCGPKQLEVFQPCHNNTRKIILSTNIAETSVTISGIKYVVDSGMVKQKFHHPTTGLDMLKVHHISKAQAWQRAGRAGRESEGFCYRCYTKPEFDRMISNTVPEILRTNLSGVVLQLLALKINVLTFDFMDKPPNELIVAAIQQLKYLEAIEDSNELNLSHLGRHMALFPLEPRFSKVILSAKDFGCVEEVITIMALLSGESIFVTNIAKREEASAAKEKFASSLGDHITLLNVYRGYVNHSSSKHQWCYENFLNSRNLDYACKVRKQLADICLKCNIPLTSCGDDFDSVRKSFITGFFMNIAELQNDKKYLTVTKKQTVLIHPQSVLHNSYPPTVIFTEIVQTGKCYMKSVMPVNPEWIEEIAPAMLNGDNIFDVD